MFLVESQGGYILPNLSHYILLLHSIKLSGHEMEIKFDKDHLTVEQNNCVTKIVNAYIAYDLNA